MSDLGEIERDGSREYIPLPGGWEIQTKGEGSSYRLLDKKSNVRHNILSADSEFIHEFVTRMAKDVYEASATTAAELTRLREQCEAKDAEMRAVRESFHSFCRARAAEIEAKDAEIERLKVERDEALMNLTNEQCRKADDTFDAYNDLASANKQIASLSAENERLKEHVRDISRECNESLVRIDSLESQLQAFRVAAKMVECERSFGGIVKITTQAYDALMSALRMGEKDGLE